MYDYKEFAVLIVLFFIALLFWRSVLMYPLKLLVTLLHECGHALAAALTGGKRIVIKVFVRGGGVTEYAGGIRFFVLNAGYLGSIIFGFLIFYLPYTRYGPYSLEVFGVIILLITILWVRNIFTFLFSVSMAAGLILLSTLVSGELDMFLAKFIGVCGVLYPFLDINLYRNFGPLESDVQQLGQLTKIPAIFWGGIWWLISLGVLIKLFQVALSGKIF